MKMIQQTRERTTSHAMALIDLLPGFMKHHNTHAPISALNIRLSMERGLAVEATKDDFH